MSLHYLVRRKMLKMLKIRSSCQREETPEFILPNCGLNSPDLNPVDYRIWAILQQKVFKILITDLDVVDALKQRLRTEWATLDHVVIVAASGVVDRSRSVMHILYPFSRNILSHTVIR